MRFAETELQNTIELRATASEIAAPKPDRSRRQNEKKDDFEALFKNNFKKENYYRQNCENLLTNQSRSLHGCSHANTIYDFQLQKTVLRMQPRHEATLTQPFQCNLQPEIQEPHRTTHTDTTTRCKTHRRNNSRTKRPQPHPSHRRGTFHRRLQPLYMEKHKVWCSGFLPKT